MVNEGLFVRACNYRVGITSDRIITTVVLNRNCRLARSVRRTSTIVVGAYSVHSGTRRGIIGHLRCVRSLHGGRHNIVINMVNYVTRHVRRRLVGGRNISFITKPSTCLSLPGLINTIRHNRPTVGIRLSAARACHSIVPTHVNGAVSNFIDVVHNYGGFYSCYVIPCAHKHRHDHSCSDVVGRIGSLRDHKCGRIALLKRGIGSCHCRRSNIIVAFPRLLRHITRTIPNVHVHFAASRPGSVDSRALRIVTHRGGLYGFVRLPIRDNDGRVLGVVGHGCAHR